MAELRGWSRGGEGGGGGDESFILLGLERRTWVSMWEEEDEKKDPEGKKEN